MLSRRNLLTAGLLAPFAGIPAATELAEGAATVAIPEVYRELQQLARENLTKLEYGAVSLPAGSLPNAIYVRPEPEFTTPMPYFATQLQSCHGEASQLRKLLQTLVQGCWSKTWLAKRAEAVADARDLRTATDPPWSQTRPLMICTPRYTVDETLPVQYVGACLLTAVRGLDQESQHWVKAAEDAARAANWSLDGQVLRCTAPQAHVGSAGPYWDVFFWIRLYGYIPGPG